MKYLKKYGLCLLKIILTLLITLLLLSTIYYFNIINNQTYKILKTIIIIGTILSYSYLLGKKCTNKGYLEGLILGLTISTTFILISLITSNFTIKSLLYYLILIITSTLGSMIGINKKELKS